MRRLVTTTSRVITAVLAHALAQTVSHAAPATPPAPPQPAVGLGTTTFLDAEGGVGTLVQVLGSGYKATRVNDAAGEETLVDFRQHAEVALIHVAHTSNVKLLGAYLGSEVLLPLAHVSLRAGDLRESTTGIGDATVGMYLQWQKLALFGRPLSARLDLDIATPTGAYNRDRNVNLGNKLWQVSPYLAWTLRLSERWEISNRINYNWSSVSHRPPFATSHETWQPGDQIAVNLSASYAITERWRVGIGGYTLQQLRDSRTDGARLPDSRQSVFGAGPSARWNFGRTTMIASAYKEFEAQNRSEGYLGVLRLMRVY